MFIIEKIKDVNDKMYWKYEISIPVYSNRRDVMNAVVIQDGEDIINYGKHDDMTMIGVGKIGDGLHERRLSVIALQTNDILGLSRAAFGLREDIQEDVLATVMRITATNSNDAPEAIKIHSFPLLENWILLLNGVKYHLSIDPTVSDENIIAQAHDSILMRTTKYSIQQIIEAPISISRDEKTVTIDLMVDNESVI